MGVLSNNYVFIHVSGKRGEVIIEFAPAVGLAWKVTQSHSKFSQYYDSVMHQPLSDISCNKFLES